MKSMVTRVSKVSPRPLALVLGLGIGAFLASPAGAQLESPLLSKIQPNLVNPGGKSLAMGGAFVSLADDGTAAIANPSGLPQLGSYQLGISGKSFRFTPPLSTANYFSSGTTSELQSIDSYRPAGTASDIEFASLVIPIFSNLSIAGYRAVNLRFNLDASDLTGGNYRSFFVNRASTSSVSIDEQGGLDIRNELYGASVGAKFGPLAVGGGVTFNRLRYELTGGAAGGNHLFIANADNGTRSNVPDPRFDTVVTNTVNSGTRTGWIVGFRADLYEPARLAIGGVYRKSPSFEVGYSVSATRAFDRRNIAEFSCGVDDPRIPSSGASACGTFKVPDDYAVGISGMPIKNLLIAVEIQRVKYSQFNDGFVPLFVYCRNPIPNAACPAAERAISRGSSDDGTVPRFGAEYTLQLSGTEVNIRAGYYREPAHGMRLDLYPDADRDRRADNGPPIEVTNPPFSAAYRTSFDGGTVDNHVSFGLGATLLRRFSVDLAFDFGKASKQAVLSAFARF